MKHFAVCLCPFCIMARAVARERERALRAMEEFRPFTAGDVRRAIEEGGAFDRPPLPPGEVRLIAETILGWAVSSQVGMGRRGRAHGPREVRRAVWPRHN